MELCDVNQKNALLLEDVLDTHTNVKLTEWNIRECLMWLASYK